MRFNQYLETLLSTHSTTIGALDRRDRPAWLGTAAADTIFTVARNRVYTQKAVPKDIPADRTARETTIDGLEIPNDLAEDDWMAYGPTDEEEQLLRDLEETARVEREGQARQSDAPSGNGNAPAGSTDMAPPPAPGPKSSTTPAPQKRKRTKWLPPGVEPVLEPQPKWSLLEQVLDEVETHMCWAPHDPCTCYLRLLLRR